MLKCFRTISVYVYFLYSSCGVYRQELVNLGYDYQINQFHLKILLLLRTIGLSLPDWNQESANHLKTTLKYFNLLVISLAVICLTEIKILLILKKLAFFFSSLLLIIRLRASLHESFRPGINSSRCLVIFLLLFTWWYSTAERSNVCQNSSRDETHLGSHVKRPLILDSWNALKPSMSIFGAFVS